MKKTFPICLGLCAAMFSSCHSIENDSQIAFVNETDKDCVISFDYTESHRVHHGYTNLNRQDIVKAHCSEMLSLHESCRPSEIYSRFTVVSTDGDTLYHASPVDDKDWTNYEEKVRDSKAITYWDTWVLKVK